MTKHRVYLFNASRPTRRIVETTCKIIVAKKTAWAEEENGRRHLLGSSAFYTLEAASRAKRGALQRIIDTRALERMPATARLHLEATFQMIEYQEKGAFPVRVVRDRAKDVVVPVRPR